MIYPQFVAEWFDNSDTKTTAWDATTRHQPSKGGDIVSAAELAEELADDLDEPLPPPRAPVPPPLPKAVDPQTNQNEHDRGQWWGTGQVARAEWGSTPLLDATETDSRHSRAKQRSTPKTDTNDTNDNGKR